MRENMPYLSLSPTLYNILQLYPFFCSIITLLFLQLNNLHWTYMLHCVHLFIYWQTLRLVPNPGYCVVRNVDLCVFLSEMSRVVPVLIFWRTSILVFTVSAIADILTSSVCGWRRGWGLAFWKYLLKRILEYQRSSEQGTGFQNCLSVCRCLG